MTDDKLRPEHESQDEDARRERREGRQERHEGQVSELADPGPEAGGADATDKSTGTAPDRADEPGT
jgi:hypothetical protein